MRVSKPSTLTLTLWVPSGQRVGSDPQFRFSWNRILHTKLLSHIYFNTEDPSWMKVKGFLTTTCSKSNISMLTTCSNIYNNLFVSKFKQLISASHHRNSFALHQTDQNQQWNNQKGATIRQHSRISTIHHRISTIHHHQQPTSGRQQVSNAPETSNQHSSKTAITTQLPNKHQFIYFFNINSKPGKN